MLKGIKFSQPKPPPPSFDLVTSIENDKKYVAQSNSI